MIRLREILPKPKIKKAKHTNVKITNEKQNQKRYKSNNNKNLNKTFNKTFKYLDYYYEKQFLNSYFKSNNVN